MKKTLLTIMALLTSFTLVSCNENATSTSNPTEDDGKYRVTVQNPNGENLGANITVQWCSDTNCYSSLTNENGVATIELEPARYDIHLFDYPSEYAFHLGSYVAEADNKSIVVQLNNLSTPTSGTGASEYDFFSIGEGVYNTTIETADTYVYYGFKATRPGKYSIESWADGVDTYIKDFGGNSSYIDSNIVHGEDNDSGYASNFKYEFNIGIDQFVTTGETDADGNPIYEKDADGNFVCGATYIFGISATGFKRAKTFSFAVTWLDDYIVEKIVAEEVLVTETLTQFPNNDSEYLVYKEMPLNGTIDVFFNETDRFYHAKRVNGPILLAKITQPCSYIDLSFKNIQDPGNSALTLDNGTHDYTNFINQYAEVCNEDGVYGVTEELKVFLESFYISAEKWISEHATQVIDEDYAWLFACGFYTDIADSYASPSEGDGTETNPYIILHNANDNEFYAKVPESGKIYYRFYTKNREKEEIYYISTTDANSKITFNNEEYCSESGAYIEDAIGGLNNSLQLDFIISTVDGKEDGFVFEFGIREITVDGDKITIGENTVAVPDNGGSVECSFTAPYKGIYTVSTTESNAYIIYDNQEYIGSSSFEVTLEAGAVLEFTVYADNFAADNITFTLNAQALATTGRNSVSVGEWETLPVIFFAEESDSEYVVYTISSSDENISIGYGSNIEWKYGENGDCEFEIIARPGDKIEFYIATADHLADTVGFVITLQQ